MNVQSFIEKVMHQKKNLVAYRAPRMIHPLREWAVGLLVTTLLFVGATTYLGYDFYIQFKSVDTPTVNDETVVAYRSKSVPSILEQYQIQAKTFEQLRKGRVIVAATISPEQTISTSTTATSSLAKDKTAQ